MKPLAFVVVWSSCVLGVLFAFSCVTDAPDVEDPPPAARIVIAWDPLLCGVPHRVVVELEDDDGVELASSTPCSMGMLTLDAPRWGIYRGRFYAWVLDEPIRSITRISIAVDAPIVRWMLATPP